MYQVRSNHLNVRTHCVNPVSIPPASSAFLARPRAAGKENMFTRDLANVEKSDFFVDWGNGTSHRLLTQQDGMGFTVCHTVVRAGSESRLHYRRHFEACYCIAGAGEIEDMYG